MLVFIVIGVGLAIGCGEEDKPKSGNGVNDIKLACEIRAKWNRNGNNCGLCETGVVAPRCDCVSLEAFSAACIDQADARKSACNDNAIDICIQACDRADCTCIDGCYATAQACKAASAARDGCIAEACASYCK